MGLCKPVSSVCFLLLVMYWLLLFFLIVKWLWLVLSRTEPKFRHVSMDFKEENVSYTLGWVRTSDKVGNKPIKTIYNYRSIARVLNSLILFNIMTVIFLANFLTNFIFLFIFFFRKNSVFCSSGLLNRSNISSMQHAWYCRYQYLLLVINKNFTVENILKEVRIINV